LAVREAAARDLRMADFAPREQSRAGELAVRFDIVLGDTPQA